MKKMEEKKLYEENGTFQYRISMIPDSSLKLIIRLGVSVNKSFAILAKLINSFSVALKIGTDLSGKSTDYDLKDTVRLSTNPHMKNGHAIAIEQTFLVHYCKPYVHPISSSVLEFGVMTPRALCQSKTPFAFHPDSANEADLPGITSDSKMI
ncbi:hypothetical protein STEG23_015280, partial [Scotinomys teguina]